MINGALDHDQKSKRAWRSPKSRKQLAMLAQGRLTGSAASSKRARAAMKTLKSAKKRRQGSLSKIAPLP